VSLLSDRLLVVTILAYLAAMLGYAAEYSFGRRGAVARVASRELATVGGPVVSGSPGADPPGADPVAADPVAADPPRADPVAADPLAAGAGRSALLGRLAVAATLAAVSAHALTLVTRGLAAGRVPWGNMYEFVLTVCLVGAVSWLVLLVRRPAVRPLGLYVSLALVVLLGFAGMRLYTKAAPLVPALNSYWLKIHVTAAATASGILLLGFLAAALYLVRQGYDAGRRSFPFTLGSRLPAASGLERLSFRLHAFAFPIWTLAIICGAIWAEAAWGRYWGWDPKETWSFISWVVYAGYLHARATPSVKRTVATWIAVAGWLTMMINLYGVNLVISGLHSYAGVK
jgi:cytochrome c-type biogenesis protein CcsB